jgi:hypothetical protein
MGDRQENKVTKDAELAAIAVLRPQIDALTDLAKAEFAAGQADAIRTRAQQRAQQILDEADAEIDRRIERWRVAFHAARAAGWTVKQLRSKPIGRQQPPAATRKRGNGTTPRKSTVNLTGMNAAHDSQDPQPEPPAAIDRESVANVG